MAKFRKKPVVIEAFKVSVVIKAARDNWDALPECLRDAYESGKILFAPDKVHIKTLEGAMIGNRDDWIIRGVAGELYPCKPDIFATTYDPAPPEDTP